VLSRDSKFLRSLKAAVSFGGLMNIENQDPVVTKVLNEILKDESLWTPVYRADVKTDDDARAKMGDLLWFLFGMKIERTDLATSP